MRISDWSSDVCSSDLLPSGFLQRRSEKRGERQRLRKKAGQQRRVIVVRQNGVELRPQPHDPSPRVAARYRKGDAAIRVAQRIMARSEERRVGQGCVSTGRSRGSPSPKKKKKTN